MARIRNIKNFRKNVVSLKKILKYKNFKSDYAESKIKSETYLKKTLNRILL